MSADRGRLYTIGHSTHDIERFLALLTVHGIAELADIRTIPRSRHNPQFEKPALAAALNAAGLGYHHLPGLGGLRHARPDSTNVAWRNASFRGYADYMETGEFAAALAELESLAAAASARGAVAMMCAEAVPWRCHRSLVADALTVKGWDVFDIVTEKAPTLHRLTPFLRVVAGRLQYNGETEPRP